VTATPTTISHPKTGASGRTPPHGYQPPGALLSDLIETLLAFSGPRGTSSFISISFNGQASGTLPDGTSASLQVTEVGLIRVAGIANPNSRVALDAFPAEHIDIQATGH
jgi:hypothetical protein